MLHIIAEGCLGFDYLILGQTFTHIKFQKLLSCKGLSITLPLPNPDITAQNHNTSNTTRLHITCI